MGQGPPMALLLTALLGGLRPAAPFDDFLYPSAEAGEMAGLTPPAACANASGWAVVFVPPSDVAPGGPPCVLERSFEQWGVMALLPAAGGAARLLRKSVGELSGIAQPRYNFTGSDPQYFETALHSLTDHLSEVALASDGAGAGPADGELSYGALAQTLTPARDVTEISLASDVVKFLVSHSGRIKCSAGTNITESQNLSAPLAASQKVIFDPSQHLSYWPSEAFDDMKSGGRYDRHGEE